MTIFLPEYSLLEFLLDSEFVEDLDEYKSYLKCVLPILYPDGNIFNFINIHIHMCIFSIHTHNDIKHY